MALMSLPSRERGLKYFMAGDVGTRYPSLPSRERGLKLVVGVLLRLLLLSRSLRGSVD